MAVTRMTLDEALAKAPDVDRAKVDATTEEDIRRHMAEDGEDPDTAPRPEDWYPSAASIRRRLGMTQERFAEAIRVPVATLRNWEQHRVSPTRPPRRSSGSCTASRRRRSAHWRLERSALVDDGAALASRPPLAGRAIDLGKEAVRAEAEVRPDTWLSVPRA